MSLVEHHADHQNPTDPDYQHGTNPPTYEAIRISSPRVPAFNGPVEAVYVEYRNPQHEIEYYDISKDPNEIRNIAQKLTSAQRTELHSIVAALENCHDAARCWSAGLPR